MGIAGERLEADLDEDTLRDLSVSNRMVKAMFESSAPKYRFGGSGSNLSLASSKEELRQGPVRRPAPKPTEERKWVMESINKFFDVIVEEEDDEDGEDGSEDEYEDDEEEEEEMEEEEEEEEETKFKSSAKMRGLLSSVVTKLSGSVGNLAGTNLVHSLKRNLGSQINLRASNKDLSQY